MATVRFSNEFRNTVIHRALNIFKPKLQAVVDTQVPSHWAEHIYLKMFGQESIDKMNTLPMEYFDSVKEFVIEGFTKEHNSSRGTTLPKICNGDNFKEDINSPSNNDRWALHRWVERDLPRITLKFPTKKRWPEQLPSGIKGIDDGRVWNGSTTVRFLAQDDRWSTMWSEWVELRMKLEKVLMDRKKFITGVNTIMDTYNTLGPALKVFPGLWDLLEDKYKDRHRAEDKRANAKKVAQDLSNTIDVNSLTAQVTAHKLTK